MTYQDQNLENPILIVLSVLALIWNALFFILEKNMGCCVANQQETPVDKTLEPELKPKLEPKIELPFEFAAKSEPKCEQEQHVQTTSFDSDSSTLKELDRQLKQLELQFQKYGIEISSEQIQSNNNEPVS